MRSLLILTAFLMTQILAQGQLPKNPKTGVTYTTASGLMIKFIEINDKNEKPQTGDMVKVHYTGRLTNDTIFDSSVKRGTPFSFALGRGKVIKGWDEGIAYLHKGDSAILTIPATLGYGARQMGTIPANSTLVFEVKLVDFTVGARPYDATGKDTITTETGLRYCIISKGKGPKVESGMMVKVHYTGFFENGKVFDSSVERGEPIDIPIGKGMVIKGWDEGICKLNVGDKAKLFIPYKLGYGEVAKGHIPAKSNLIFDVEVISAEQGKTAVPFDVKGKDTLTTASGLKYIIIQNGSGNTPVKGNTVKVDYTGYFTSGKIFDSSVERNSPFSFVLGEGNVIAGWDEGIALLKKGSKARLIIPYNLGYGEADFGTIPGKSTLIFDVELLDVN